MAKSCSHLKIKLKYPQHFPKPEDLLTFVESNSFSADWDAMGLDLEDDLESLQICIMANPGGDGVIEGSGGLYWHTHYFQKKKGPKEVTVYYGYFPDFGFAYMNCVDTERLVFTQDELAGIRVALLEAELALERRRQLRIRTPRQ